MNPNEQAFSVTQLNEYVKMLIDSDEILQTAAVCGEISNFKHHYATGHLYFTLKDEPYPDTYFEFPVSSDYLRR